MSFSSKRKNKPNQLLMNHLTTLIKAQNSIQWTFLSINFLRDLDIKPVKLDIEWRVALIKLCTK